MISFGKTVSAVTAAAALQLDVAAFNTSAAPLGAQNSAPPGVEEKAARQLLFAARDAEKLYGALAPMLRCTEDLLPENIKLLIVHFGVNHGSPESFAQADAVERQVIDPKFDEPETSPSTIARGVTRLTRHFKQSATVPFIATEGATNGASAFKSINFVAAKLHALQSKSDAESQKQAAEILKKVDEEPNRLSAIATISAGRSGLTVRGIEATNLAASLESEAVIEKRLADRALELKLDGLKLRDDLLADTFGTNVQLQTLTSNFYVRAAAFQEDLAAQRSRLEAANDRREDENLPIIVAQALSARKGSELVVIPLIFGAEHNFSNNIARWNSAHPESQVGYLQFTEIRRPDEQP